MVDSAVPNIEASDTFQRAYGKLSNDLRATVDNTIAKLALNPDQPGLNVERVQRASKNIRSCRVTKAYRIIFEIADTRNLLLHYVGKHDEAYKKAILYFIKLFQSPEGLPDEGFGSYTKFEPRRDQVDNQSRANLDRALAASGIQSDLSSIIADLIEQAVARGTDGKAKPVQSQRSGLADMVNVIPSQAEASCGDVLLAFCFDNDSFGNRLREMAYHAGIHCPNTNTVILVTGQWNAKEWKRDHEEAFADLNATLLIFFVGLGRVITQLA